MIAASFGEVVRVLFESMHRTLLHYMYSQVACSVRVPTEVVKQRMQAGGYSSISAVLASIQSSSEGWLGLYKGFGITIMREIPYALIQFPAYEALMVRS